MAPTFSRKYLVCFYCNKKSTIKYHRRLEQWECTNCQSMNHLDENGDITDPPVATEYVAPVEHTYATARPESPPLSQESDASIFCSTCLKNQHLLTSSLAQYDIDLDSGSPLYKENERQYYQYRKGLEKLYPQVCEDCEPKVLERMRQAGKTAKTDYLRRLMERSRSRRSTISANGLSYESIGQLLWFFGLAGQLLWHVIALSTTLHHFYPSPWQQYLPINTDTHYSNLPRLFNPFSTSTLVRSSLLCSVASVWWNPKFKQMKTGFMNHIKGFGDWYKYQALLLVVRGLCYFFMGTGVMADSYTIPNTTAHAFLFGFITCLAVAAHRSLKVDMTPLWASTPEKLPYVRPKPSTSATNATNSMADLLDEIGASTSQRSYNISPSISSLYGYQHDIQKSPSGPKPQTERLRNFPASDVQNEIKQIDEMDWSPSQPPQSQHRAFALNLQRDAQQFGQTPTGSDPSPFWYKVPPAPITPAHRLRNPPNQPRLRVSSQDVKENFFNNVTQRKVMQEQSTQDTRFSKTNTTQYEVKFAQQKYFPPPPPSEVGDSLSQLMDTFSLGSSDDEILIDSPQSYSKRHASQALVLSIGLALWNQVLYYPADYNTRNVEVVVMIVCFLIGLRTIADNVLYSSSKKQFSYRQTFELCLGIVECLGALYGALEICIGRGVYKELASLGSVLIIGMVIQNACHALFG